ncbi:hypothetical protein RJ639_021520 [Escallonia herrerae]|uniref:PPC domain-containing protein n=1 Tax=Escallonia herrerae TaxID=1293975 RepID=A0AA89AEC6_9ASTE|nr:hypothetical protein RJ639_021520 [Escallonia herrerae]
MRSVSRPQPRGGLSNASDEHLSPQPTPPLTIITGASGGGGGGGGSSSAPPDPTPRRKPRGRPPGSRNKPKPPTYATEPVLKPASIEVSAGSDIINTVLRFARSSGLSLVVLSCSGTVSNVTIRHLGSQGPPLTLNGPFSILSLTGTFSGYPSSSSSCFGISLAGAQGQLYGGEVAGKVIAATHVELAVTTFVGATRHVLPAELHMAESDQGGVASEGRLSSMSIAGYGVSVTPHPDHGFSWAPTPRPHPPY